jgi:hypothetical protein
MLLNTSDSTPLRSQPFRYPPSKRCPRQSPFPFRSRPRRKRGKRPKSSPRVKLPPQAEPPIPVAKLAFGSTCPTLSASLQQVVGPGGVWQYTGGIAALGATWLTRASMGPWGAVLAVSGIIYQVGGKAIEDFEKVASLVTSCEAHRPHL